MKKILILPLLLASVVSLADGEESSPIIAETLLLNGATNTWTQADLIAAL